MWDKKENGSRSGTDGGGYPAYGQNAARNGRSVVNIGPSIQIKGELQGDEDLTIDGRIEGQINLREHNLTIGSNGKIRADLQAKTIVIAGEVTGNAVAAERVELTPSGRLNGNITAPRITIADGAHFKGSVDMERGADARTAKSARPEEVRRIPEVKEDASLKSQARA